MEYISTMQIELFTTVSYDSRCIQRSMLTSATELNNWIINAFNGEWLRTVHAVPSQFDTAAKTKRNPTSYYVGGSISDTGMF